MEVKNTNGNRKHTQVHSGIALALFLLLTTLSSCTENQTKIDRMKSQKFFDLDGTMIAIKDNLPRMKAMVTKTIVYNGKKEVVQMKSDTIDWDQELAMLNQYDLQATRLKGIFNEKRDTLESGRVEVSYSPINDETTISVYEVSYDTAGIPIEVYIEKKDSTYAAKQYQKVRLNFGVYYEKNPILTGYTFSRISDVRQLGKETLSVSSEISFLDSNVFVREKK